MATKQEIDAFIAILSPAEKQDILANLTAKYKKDVLVSLYNYGGIVSGAMRINGYHTEAKLVDDAVKKVMQEAG